MARRPSYSFERSQRDRAKVAKREAKRDARAARKSGDATDDATAPDAEPLETAGETSMLPEEPAAAGAVEEGQRAS